MQYAAILWHLGTSILELRPGLCINFEIVF